jgi:hypothetical protein
MEAMLRISLYSYLYFKLAKTLSVLLLHCLHFNKIEKRAEQVLPGSEAGRGEREGAEGRGEKWPKQCMHI